MLIASGEMRGDGPDKRVGQVPTLEPMDEVGNALSRQHRTSGETPRRPPLRSPTGGGLPGW
jgi:hypothetical protein